MSECPIAKDLLNIIICPACMFNVAWNVNELGCQNNECRTAYPLNDGIPVMIIEVGRTIPETEWPPAT